MRMDSFNQYHPDDDVSRSLAVLFAFSSISVLLLFVWDVPSLLVDTGESLTIGPSKMLMLLWHVICLTFGLSAIVYMFRMKTGHMIVRSHEQKADILIHPLRIKKFVTFSSWTLILNVLYFSFATLASILILFETSLPTWLLQSLGSIFVTALGASFLTSTVVRYVILPGNHIDEEHHKRQFWFHNQMMHNFCTIFLVVNILLTSPQLEFVYMLFGILIGLAYALFAFPFAAFGGGYYCYSFIDPRLQKAPLFITMLALAISISYIGVWFVSELVSFNIFLGGLLLIVWCSQIVQFKPLNA
ncbi:MAG: hypothetical protein VXY42_05935 [Candidatus Thermoplasmatota archaeon]|nr:hypothetical protein [Candidatus Thermoplasmatota archaeon]